MKFTVCFLLVIAGAVSGNAGDDIIPPEYRQTADSVVNAMEELERLGPLSDETVRSAIPKLATLQFPTDRKAACDAIGISPAYVWGRFYQIESDGFKWVRFELTDTYCILFKARSLSLDEVFAVRIERIDSLKDLNDFSAVGTVTKSNKRVEATATAVTPTLNPTHMAL